MRSMAACPTPSAAARATMPNAPRCWRASRASSPSLRPWTSGTLLAEWLKAINQVHRQDPEQVDGQPAELIYAMHLERWIGELVAAPGAALLLAARCQHLERWAIARSEFAADKAGYFAWRKAVHQHQGRRAGELLAAAGCPEALTARVAQLVAKAATKGDPEGQALEDAACLVFLETELTPFAAEHPDYTREKFIDIIRKTWRKMSPDGHRLALAIPLPADLAELVKAALAPGGCQGRRPA